MRGLVLYGASCTLDVWDFIKDDLLDYDLTYVDYPHEIINTSQNITDITKWVYHTYKNEQYDFVIGHSMGGLIALELVARFNFICEKIILIESNLKPANEFYRNLMLPFNLKKYGDWVIPMIKEESKYYTDNIKKSLQESFDFTGLIRNTHSNVYGIYGDRGKKHYDRRIDDLNLDAETIKKIDFRFASDSCHMPMIENPNELVEIINRIILNN